MEVLTNQRNIPYTKYQAILGKPCDLLSEPNAQSYVNIYAC